MDLVAHCLEEGELEPEPVGAGPASPRLHAARIAWLVLHDDPEPIEIDVGMGPEQAPRWIVTDGNHRLYAAIFRGETHVEATISGSEAQAKALLGVDLFADALPPDVLPGHDGRIFEVVTDGRTVWVNADDGMSVGRFSKRGVDVHADAQTQMETGRQCLACVHDLPPPEAWDVFVGELAEHYGIALPDDLRPEYALEEAMPDFP